MTNIEKYCEILNGIFSRFNVKNKVTDTQIIGNEVIISIYFKRINIGFTFPNEIQQIFNKDEVLDVKIKKFHNIDLIYDIKFFDSEEKFTSYKAINKFNL